MDTLPVFGGERFGIVECMFLITLREHNQQQDLRHYFVRVLAVASGDTLAEARGARGQVRDKELDASKTKRRRGVTTASRYEIESALWHGNFELFEGRQGKVTW